MRQKTVNITKVRIVNMCIFKKKKKKKPIFFIQALFANQNRAFKIWILIIQGKIETGRPKRGNKVDPCNHLLSSSNVNKGG